MFSNLHFDFNRDGWNWLLHVQIGRLLANAAKNARARLPDRRRRDPQLLCDRHVGTASITLRQNMSHVRGSNSARNCSSSRR